MRYLFLLLFCVYASSASALEQDLYTFANTPDMQRYQGLVKEIRCVVCQGQNIADSNAPLAADLRKKVYDMINDQKSDVEIKDYLVKRYGEFILYNPRLNKLTILLWAFPFLGLVGVFTLIALRLWSGSRRGGIA